MNALAVPQQMTLADDQGNIGETTEVSWVAPAEMTYEQWTGVGSTFQQISRSINWWIGDWLNAGEARWGEMAMQAVEETGRGVDSLLKCKAVAMRFNVEARLDALSWSHHRAVAYLDGTERDEWLGAAITYQISTRDLNVIARFDRQQRSTLLKVASAGASLDEFMRIFELVRLDREAEPRPSMVNGAKPYEGEYDGQFDEEEDGLPFDEMREQAEWIEVDNMDIEEIFAYFENQGATVKVIQYDECIWQGISVRAVLNAEGAPFLLWEQIP